MRTPGLLVIEAGRSERHYWRDLWGYRELFFFLAWRDILVRHKQAVIGNGDDDAISPSLPAKLREIGESLNTALMMSWHVGLYFHPDWDRGEETNTFSFHSGHSRALIDVDPLAVFASYARLDIPTVFPQGTRMCFSSRLAERAVVWFGKLFWGPYPDFSSPLILPGLLQGERYIYVDEPLGYGGRSKLSNAAAIDKDAGNEQNQERMKEFYKEFQEDIYPHQPIKARSLWNGHGETVSLVRKLLPEVFGSYPLDTAALIAGIECEFRGINIYNAHLGPEARVEFDKFLSSQGPSVIEAAMRKVNNAAVLSGPERWYPHRQGRVEKVLRFLKRLETAAKLVRRARYDREALNVLKAKLVARRKPQPTAASDGGVRGNVRVLYSGRMSRIPCADMDSRDGAEVTARLEEISALFDPVTWANVEEFATGGRLRAAYGSAAAAAPPWMTSVTPVSHPTAISS